MRPRRWDLLGSPGRCVTLVGDALHPMTPNLGQGGCTALEDAVVLARTLRKEGAPALAEDSRRGADGARVALAGAVRSAVRSYERERVARCLPLTVRAHAMGVVLQLPQARVVAARDFFVERFFRAGHFLDHADYDCGQL
jgi:2-polyprenyl-6-methoxyphenol hydroxylase-like FAD-dependent oxidoreductase